MSQYYLYIKAFHVIFMVTWFAALFYMPRLLIYYVEALGKVEPNRSILAAQFKIMQRRLWYIISWPALGLTWFFGLWMLFMNLSLFTQPWFILKFILVCGLTLYHLQTHVLFRQAQGDMLTWSSFRLRLWNEIATLFLFAIILLVVPKPTSGWVWALLGLLFLAGAIALGVVMYRKQREKEKSAEADATQEQASGSDNQPPLPPANS